jgi:hypothetical protein
MQFGELWRVNSLYKAEKFTFFSMEIPGYFPRKMINPMVYFWSKVGNSDLQNKIPSGYLT